MNEETITEEVAQGMASLDYWLQGMAQAEREGYTFADALLSIPATESARFASANGL